MLGRKTIPAPLRPAWEAFTAQALRVEQARRALLGCLPVGRVDPAPVPVGLELLRDELTAVADELGAWRVAPVEQHWLACRDGVHAALDSVDRGHKIAETTTELEELLGAVGDVVEALDAWAEAERAWLRLRVRP